MRTTVDLPAVTYDRVKVLADRRGMSLSQTLSELVQAGLRGEADDKPDVQRDPDTGWPVIGSQRPVTVAEVEEFLDDDA